VEDREDDDGFGLHREVHGIWKAPQQDTADPRLEILIPEGITRSPIRIRQVPEYFVRGPRTTWVSAIRGKPLLGETKVRFWYWDLSRPLRDAIPKSLQIADLLRLRERCEPRRFLETGARRSSPAFARS